MPVLMWVVLNVWMLNMYCWRVNTRSCKLTYLTYKNSRLADVCLCVRLVFNATLNSIPVISCRWSVYREETGVPGWKQPTLCKSLVNFIAKLYQAHLIMSGNRNHNFTFQGDSIDFIFKSAYNYHTMVATLLPPNCIYLFFEYYTELWQLT